jgi:tetratricopeptide (TPR) repeat protein
MFRIALIFAALASSQTPEDLYWAGATSFEQSRFGEAEDQLRQALALAERTQHPSIPRIQLILARTLLVQEKFPEAETLLQLALQGMNQSAAFSPRDTAGVLHALAVLYRAVGRTDEAEMTAERGLKTIRSAPGPSEPEAAGLRSLLGMLMLEKGDLSKADRYLRQALTILEPTQSIELPIIWYNVGQVRYLQNKLDESEVYFRRTLASQDPEHPLVALTLENLAQIKLRRGFPADALALNSEALALAQKAFPPGNRSFVSMLLNHAKILRALGRKQEAGAVEVRAKEAARSLVPDPRLRHRIDVRTFTK